MRARAAGNQRRLAKPEAMRVTVSVKPGSQRPGIEQDGDMLIVRVRERAVEGAANAAVLRAIATHFGVSPSRVTLVRGARSKTKQIDVT